MDPRSSIIEKRQPKPHGSSNGRLPPVNADEPIVGRVEFREMDLVRDIADVIPLYYKGWLEVVGEDKSKPMQIVLKGKEFEGPEIEFLLYYYLDQNYKVRLCYLDGLLAGMCMYTLAFDCSILIRFMYFEKECRGSSLSAAIVDSIRGVKAIIFQTQKARKPEGLFAAVRDRATYMYETNDAVTWFMPWERK